MLFVVIQCSIPSGTRNAEKQATRRRKAVEELVSDPSIDPDEPLGKIY